MRLRSLACGLMLLLSAGASPLQAQGHAIKQMFVFGDSYSDTGAGYVDGDGPTAVWYLAKDLGLRLDLPKDAKPVSSLNFAVSGAQTGSGEGRRFEHGELLGYGMRNQVDDFAVLVSKGAVRFTGTTTLFFLAGGLNDRSLPVETSVANLEGEIETLYGLGARRFQVALMPEKIPGFAAQGIRLNPALRLIPDDEKKKHADIEIGLSEWGPDFDAVMGNAARYGITNTTNACAGRALFHEDTATCKSPETYYFYHAGHPSTHTHEIVGAMLAEAMKR